jgi:hypothetical protein
MSRAFLKNMTNPNQHFGYLSLLEIFDSGDDYLRRLVRF